MVATPPQSPHLECVLRLEENFHRKCSLPGFVRRYVVGVKDYVNAARPNTVELLHAPDDQQYHTASQYG